MEHAKAVNYIKADLEIIDSKLKVSFSRDAISHNRWGEWGAKVHTDNTAKGHRMASAGKDVIAKKGKLFDKKPIELPEIG